MGVLIQSGQGDASVTNGLANTMLSTKHTSTLPGVGHDDPPGDLSLSLSQPRPFREQFRARSLNEADTRHRNVLQCSPDLVRALHLVRVLQRPGTATDGRKTTKRGIATVLT